MIVAYDEVKPAPLELMDLPDEILVSIAASLDFDSLLNVVSVSKHFHEVAEPFLYESITVLHGDKALDLSHSLQLNRRRAEWVRSLLISTKFGQEHALFKLPPFLRSMRNIQDLRLETPDCNAKRPEDRIFWIQLQECYEKIFEQSSLVVPDPRNRLLPNLKTCVLHFVDTHTELYSLSKYAAIFLHPTLQTLTISCMSTDFPQRLFEDVEDIDRYKKSTGLQHLHLEECDILPSSLELLLSLPRALKSLKISEGIRYDGVFRAGSSRLHGNMKPRHFADALVNTCKDSLESLSLSLGYLRSPNHHINHSDQHLKLNELECLKHLEVNNRTLNLIRNRPRCDHNTWRRLPQSLETLKVCSVPLMPPPHDKNPYIPLEECIIREKANHGVPNLSTIIYSYEHYDTADDDEMNFNDLLMNLVYNNEVNANIPAAGGGFGDNANGNHILNLLQQAAAAANNPQHPVPVQQPQPVHAGANFIAAAQNPNLDMPPQNVQPPRFRWRTGTRRGSSSPTDLSRSDAAKYALLNVINESFLPHFEQTQTRLQIDLVTLPRGFIPPYLFPEDKPRVRTSWFDSHKPRTATAFLENIRRRQARRTAAAQAAAAAYAASSSASSSSSPSPVDRNLGAVVGRGFAANSERERSRNVFMRRLRNGDLDEDWMNEDDEEEELGEESNSSANSEEDMEVEDAFELLNEEARQANRIADSETDTDTDTDAVPSEYAEADAANATDSETSVYLDAETEVEMTEAESLDGSASENER